MKCMALGCPLYADTRLQCIVCKATRCRIHGNECPVCKVIAKFRSGKIVMRSSVTSFISVVKSRRKLKYSDR